MANGQTSNYGLNQWIAEDLFLREEFNADNSKLDEALTGLQGQVDALESGTLNLPGIAGLRAGMKEALARRQEAHARMLELCGFMREALLSLQGVRVYTQKGASLLSFNVGGVASQEAASVLDTEGIAVRGGLHCAPGVHRFLGTLETGAVRVSPGLYSTMEDAKALVRAVQKIAR